MLLIGGRWLLIFLISQRRRPPVRPGSMAVLKPILSPAQVVVTQWD
jgi:hypothetical protein